MYTAWANRFIGVEMEVWRETRDGQYFDGYEARDALSEAGLRVGDGDVDYYHSDGSTWDMKTDSSCGFELASPKLKLTEAGQNEDIQTACNVLNAEGARVTGSCGLHVHVDCSDFNDIAFQRLMRIWLRYEPTIYSLVPSSRRTNDYCLPMRKVDFMSGTEVSAWEQRREALEMNPAACLRRMRDYHGGRGGINIGHYWSNGRVEFRLHSGTTSYEKVVRWAALCASIVARAMNDTLPMPEPIRRNETAQRVSIRHFGRMLGLLPSKALPEVHPYGATLVQYFESRAAQFNPIHEEETL